MRDPERDDEGDGAGPEATPTSLLPQQASIDPAAVRASYARLSAILADMMPTVAEVSTRRCPYKDAADLCTAAFGCRNQRRAGAPDERFRCVGDDRLDYRSAWETG